MPPTDAVYPEFGVIVKDLVDPLLTVWAELGLMFPPAPADGMTVHVWMLALAVQTAVVPSPNPAQLHVHGPVPLIVVGDPMLHRSVVGAEVNVCPFDAPQTPDTEKLINCWVVVALTQLALCLA